MGRAKEWMMEQEERGWWSRPDRYVCADCLDDDVLKALIAEHAEADECDYCGSSSSNGEPIAAPFDVVMEVIAAGIYKEWNAADNEGIPYETREGGYQCPTTDTYDLVQDYVPAENDALFKEIRDCLPDQEWCERDYYQLSPYRSLSFGWERFCDVVRHQRRYLFGGNMDRRVIRPSSVEAIDIEPDESAGVQSETLHLDDDERRPDEMLRTIGQLVIDAGLLKCVPPGTRFKRARIHSASRRFRSSTALGPPPPTKARYANRMSPAGIPMFYGALDGYTAVAETQTGRIKKSEIISVAEFLSVKEFWVVDLSTLPRIPSRFSESSRYERGAIRFLHDFVSDLSKPVKRDGREHIEYVPTQIVTEYFRHAFNPGSNREMRGLYYPSSRVKMGIACVLFFDQENCGAKPKSKWVWSKPEQWLRLEEHGLLRCRGRPLRDKPGPNQRGLFPR